MPDEQLDKELNDLGCPYWPVSRTMSIAWLKGYEAGHKRATEEAIKSLNKVMSNG